MRNNSKEPPKFAVKVANTVFVLGILFSVQIAIYAIYQLIHQYYHVHEGDTGLELFRFICILFGGISATLFALGLRLTNALKVNLTVLFVTATIVVYAFEAYIEFSTEETQSKKEKIQSNKALAEQMGVPYDTRTKMEVLDDLNNSGVEAYPNIHPYYLLRKPLTQNGLNTEGGKILPLGGISSKIMVQTNENGYWMKYKGDEFGFHNPEGVYRNNEIDIVMTGDSFTEGWSVKSNENISAVLRKLGFNVVNIGKSGNGPLLELAALKEYAEPLRPKIVLWIYCTNDISNLRDEISSSLLMKYLSEDDFSQNLLSRQDEIDSVLINFVRREMKIEREKSADYSAIRILKLHNLRSKIKLIARSPLTKQEQKQKHKQKHKQELAVFKNILEKSRKMVSGWGGRLYFVYLPAFAEYSTGNEHTFREFVLSTATELNIPVIDIHKEVFAPHPDPLSLSPLFKTQGLHYNAEGYRLVAETIGKRIETDGIISSKSNN